MKIISRVAAVLAFLFCFAGGLFFLCLAKDKDGLLWAGFGLYFIGKAFFVGPMLWLAAEKYCSKPDSK